MNRTNLMTLCAKVAEEVEKAVNSYNGKFSRFVTFTISQYDNFGIMIEDTGKEDDNVVFSRTLYASKEFYWTEMTPKSLKKMQRDAIKAMRDYSS